MARTLRGKSKMKSRTTLWILFFLMCLPFQAGAAGNLHFGALEIHPYVFLEETYNDNIFATPTDTQSDWITTITPGIKLFLPVRMHQFTVEYNAVINTYKDFTSENTTDHKAGAIADFKFGSFLGLKLSDTYVKGHEARDFSRIGIIDKYETNAASLSGSYQLADRSKVQLDYTRTTWNFETDAFRSRDEDLIAAYLFYRFLPKTSAFLEYDFRNIGYDEQANGLDNLDNLDNKVNSLFLGLAWDIAANTKGTVKGGYNRKEFTAPGLSGISTWGASIDINHAFSDYTFIKVVGQRAINVADLSGTSYYVTTGALAELTHKFTYKISGVVRASYSVDDYSNAIPPDTTVRNDKIMIGGLGLKYQFKDWLEFTLNYNYRDRNSNIDFYDAAENTYSFAINFAL
jgi:hypothetical protein